MHAAHEYARKRKTATMNVHTEAGNKRVENAVMIRGSSSRYFSLQRARARAYFDAFLVLSTVLADDRSLSLSRSESRRADRR